MEKNYVESGRSGMGKDVTFGELRMYISIIDRFSICMLETGIYKNYACTVDIPEEYDQYYVFGIGMIDSEFYEIKGHIYAASGERKDLRLVPCIEIVLAEEPKTVILQRDREKTADGG